MEETWADLVRALHTDGQVKGLGTGSQHAGATLPQELHVLDLIMHQQRGWLLDIEEGPLQWIQVTIISLQEPHPFYYFAGYYV